MVVQPDNIREFPPNKAKKSAPQAPRELKDFDFKEFSELASLPQPQWLIYKMLRTVGTSYLTGDPGSGKTHVAVDLACHVALGLDYNNRPVKARDVLFIEGEDMEGVAQRFIAWAQEHGVQDIPRLHIVPRPIHIPTDGMDLIDAVQKRWPDADWGLVVIDTLAANARGVNENMKHEFDEVTTKLQAIWRTLGCQVLVLHHNGTSGKIRGSSDMTGEAATHMSVSMVGHVDLTIHCEKIRGIPFDDLQFTLKQVKLSYQDDENQDVYVPVLGSFDRNPVRTIPPEVQRAIDALKKLLNATPDGVTYTAWSKALGFDVRNSLDKSRFTVLTKNCVERGEVSKEGVGKQTRYTIPCYVPPAPPTQEEFTVLSEDEITPFNARKAK